MGETVKRNYVALEKGLEYSIDYDSNVITLNMFLNSSEDGDKKVDNWIDQEFSMSCDVPKDVEWTKETLDKFMLSHCLEEFNGIDSFIKSVKDWYSQQ